MPKIGKIYKIIDIKKEFEPYWHHKFEDINYYAKIIHNRLDWRFRSQCHITCKADILDCNDNIISHHCYVDISNLSEDISGIKLSKNDATKVYLMFDKNTGYYKIGRSKNPKHREMTLQSEKPTIEMLFYFEAKNKDEKELHNLFSEKRIRGEWFDLSGTDINTIQNYFKQNT